MNDRRATGRRRDVIEAPPSRYRVVERNGRLIVLDRGQPVGPTASVTAAGAASRRAGESAADSLLGGWAQGLATRFSEQREADGRLAFRLPGVEGPGAGPRRLWLRPGLARAYGWALLALVAALLLLFPANLLLVAIGGAAAQIVSGLVTMAGILLGIGGGATLLFVGLAVAGQTTPSR